MTAASTLTFKDDIKPLFTGRDAAHMASFGIRLHDADWMVDPAGGQISAGCGPFNDHANARTVFAFITGDCQPLMPPGSPWSEDRKQIYRKWMAHGFKRGGSGGRIAGGPAVARTGLKWRPTNAPYASSRTDDIWFIDDLHGWAVNSNGHILYTSDGGASWTVQFRANVYWRCIAFADPNRGWAGTLTPRNRMFSTRDGGLSWNEVQLPTLSPAAICGLSVVNESVIWAAGTNRPDRPARVLRTEDGGSSWKGQEMGSVASNLIDCFFVTPDRGWIVGGYSPKANPKYGDVKPVVLHTADAGHSWTNQLAGMESEFPPGEWGWKIQFLSDQIGFVSLENFNDGAILKTTDGGRHWERLPINDPQGNANLEGVGFLDASTGWVGGWGNKDFSGGYSSATSDGGANWRDANEIGKNINRFRFVKGNDIQAYASGATVYRYSRSPVQTIVGMPTTRSLLRTVDRSTVVLPLEITFDIPEATDRVRLEVWDQFGWEVTLLVEEGVTTRAGRHTIRWDGKDSAGRSLGEGIYIYRLTVGEIAESRMVRIRPS